MDPNSLPQDLISRWHDLNAQGQSVSIEELCAGSPENLDALKKHLQAVASMQRFLQLSQDENAQGNTQDAGENTSILTAGAAKLRASGMVGPMRIAGYEVLAELGRGGMGVVYKARQTSLKRLVALKMIMAGSHAGPEQLARFRAEAEVVAGLQHANIVQVYEIGEHEGRPFFSMEYVDGVSLAQHLADNLLLPDHAAALVAQLADAVHFAHQRGVIHRDLKPANVLLSSASRAAPDDTVTAAPRSVSLAVPKITDFGLAKQLQEDSGLTQSGAVLGTPSYMAPEQAEANLPQIGPATDVYALGAVLYESLTGRPPFRGATLMDTLAQVRGDEPVPPSRLQAKVPADLEVICLKCLQKDPGRRYASAQALADDLGRYLRGEPIQARPINSAERLWRWCRRSPVVAGLTAVTAVLLVTVAVGSSVAAVRIHEARLRADANAATAEQQRQAEQAARQQAQGAAEDSRRRLVRLHVATAVNHLDAGDLWPALLWFTQAWLSDQNDAQQESGHRLQLAGVLERLPRLEGACFHEAPVLDAQFDPAGRRVLTRTNENQAYLWDPFTSRLLITLQHDGRVHAAAYSRDGKAVLTCSADKTARLWDAATGSPLVEPLAHPDQVLHAVFSPDGRKAATACADGQLRLWDAATGQAQGTAIVCDAVPSFVAFSPDGGRLLAALETDQARVWDANTGLPLTPLLDHLRRSKRLPGDTLGYDVDPAFSPDGRTVLTYRKGAILWDARTGLRLWQVPDKPDCKYLCFSPDGRRVLALALATGYLWETQSGEEVAQESFPREAWAGAFRPDGAWLASASTSGKIHVWDIAAGQEALLPFLHVGEITRLQFASDGQTLLASSTDGTARVWRVTFPAASHLAYDFSCGNAHRFPIQRSPEGWLRRVSPDGQWQVRYGTEPDAAQLFTRPAGAAGPALRHGEAVDYATFSPDGRLVLTGSTSDARLWDARSGAPLGPPLATGGSLAQAHFNADGRRVLTVTRDNRFTVWEASTGRALLGPMRQLPADTLSLDGVRDPADGNLGRCDISPDGRLAVIPNGMYRLVRVYAVDTGQNWAPPIHDGFVPTAEFSPDGRLVLTASSDNTARIWEPWTGRPLGPPLRHRTFVRDAAFSPDGRRIVTYEKGGAVRIWDTTTGDLLLPPLQSPGEVAWGNVWFSRDGQRVVSLPQGQNAVQWQLPALRVPTDQVFPLVRLLSGRGIDATDAIVQLRDADFRRQREEYRRAFLAQDRSQAHDATDPR